ncbi:MAG: hypothetical protein ACHP84_05495 [Caulobacterales bacterium]
MTWASAPALALALGAAAGSVLAATPATPAAALAPDIVAAAHRPAAAYPTFSDIPPAPEDIRSVGAWKRAVTAIKNDGYQLHAQAASEPWTLADTEGWAGKMQEIAKAPPPLTTPSDGESEAYAAALRARATPPPRSR